MIRSPLSKCRAHSRKSPPPPKQSLNGVPSGIVSFLLRVRQRPDYAHFSQNRGKVGDPASALKHNCDSTCLRQGRYDREAQTDENNQSTSFRRFTDFVLASAQEAATRTIKDFEMLSLFDEAREVFVKALMNPPEPNKALRAAAARYRKHVGI